MKQLKLLALIIVTMFVSCVQEYEIPTIEKERDYLPKPTRVEVEETEDGLMVLGPQLANPYLLTTMQQARAAILQEYPLASIPELETSHYYVRFAPQNDDELYSLLQDTTVVFYEYPLDREVISGTYYHDPAIADSLPTYQYASISKAVWDANYANSNIAHTILANLFIPEEAQEQLEGGDDDGGFDWEIGGGTITPIDPEPFEPRDSTGFIPFPGPGTGPIGPNGLPDGVAETNGMADLFNPSAIAEMLVDKSLVISGHETEGSAALAKNDWIPSGKITAIDDIAGTVAIVGAKVRARRWFTTHTAITDDHGEFICEKGFNRPANYSIIWERAYWKITDRNLGQAYYNGPKQDTEWNLQITSGKSLRYVTIHRGAYRIFYGNIDCLHRPQTDKKIKLKYFHENKNGLSGNTKIVNGITRKIEIYGLDNDNSPFTPQNILSTVFHELAGHATQSYHLSSYNNMSQVYKEAWAICIQYYLSLLEYNDLNKLHLLNVISQHRNYIIPDAKINFQHWSKYFSNSWTRVNYPPIFVDILDDYNQREKSTDVDENDNSNAYLYPDDPVCIDDIETLQDAVFNSINFTEVRDYLLQHYQAAITQNFEEDLWLLFSYYLTPYGDYQP